MKPTTPLLLRRVSCVFGASMLSNAIFTNIEGVLVGASRCNTNATVPVKESSTEEDDSVLQMMYQTPIFNIGVHVGRQSRTWNF
jgi:hypothetical protein